MTKMVNILVSVVIFTSLIGIIASSVADPNANITGAALVMYGLVTLFVVIGFVVGLLKSMGMKGR